MTNRISIFMVMLVVAIFAVGCVSAEENVTADIEVPTDDIAIDDIAVDDVAVDEEVENDNVIDEEQNLRAGPYYVNSGMSSSTINGIITTANTNGGGDIIFAQGNYTNIALTLKSNVKLIGNGAKLIGDGQNTVINIQNNCNNFSISGFIIDANFVSDNYNISAIRGSFVTNGVISNNTIYNGYNGVNINKYYDNITVEDNTIYGMINDAISFANPITNSNITTLGYTYIYNNDLSDSQYGIFIGGNFKGIISNNTIDDVDYGMEFKGKPKDGNGTLIATLYNNTITNAGYGINMIHPGIQYLNLTKMTFEYNGYDIVTEPIFNKLGFIGVYDCTFDYVDSTFRAAADDWINNSLP